MKPRAPRHGGVMPNEDWRECPCCGLIKPDSESSEEDVDECTECAEE